MNNTHELISSKIRLPSPPAIAIRILDSVRRDDLSFKDLARIIESDPALVAKILRVANSPYYDSASKATNIDMALSILGTQAVKILPETGFATAETVVDRLRGNCERLDFDVDGTVIKVTVSVGFTSCRHDVEIPGKGEIIAAADEALYIVKQSGRNNVQAIGCCNA